MTRIGSLFSGAGGLDLAVEAVFGGDTVWQVERETAPSAVLAKRFPGVPNHGDITEVDWRKVEPVDVLCGGFPCQDVSAAGRRAGIAEGTRSGLWLQFAKAIDALRPPVVIIENVRGLLSAKANRDTSRDMERGIATVGTGLRAAGAVLGDLADLGYDAQWATVAAAAVGAPHKRERVFIVAYPAGQPGSVEHRNGGCAGIPSGVDSGVALLPTCTVTDSAGARNSTARRSPDAKAFGLGDTLTDAMWKTFGQRGELLPTPGASDGSGGRSPARSGGVRESGAKRSVPLTDLPLLLPTPAARDHKGANPNRRDGGPDLPTALTSPDWGKYEPAIRRWEGLTRAAPHPVEPNSNGNLRLAAPFSEWMMGWPLGWVTSLISAERKRPPGTISRNEALKVIGNGVVTQQAYAALHHLTLVNYPQRYILGNTENQELAHAIS